MQLVDAHVHLGPPEYAAKPALDEAMRSERIDQAVLVQHLGNTDNDYLAAARASDPDRFAAIAIIASVPEVEGALDGGFAGLRLAPAGLAGPDGRDVFDALADKGAVVSVTGPLADVISGDFRATVRSHPSVHFRIEHVGGFRYGESTTDLEDFARLLKLAAEPNVSLMWSGFFLNAGSEYPYLNAHPYLLESLAAFGASRIMWSGDWNRADRRADDYRLAAELVGRMVASPDEQAAILAGTAQRVFGLPRHCAEGF